MVYLIDLIMRRFVYNKTIGFTLDGVSFKNVVVREVTPVDEFYFQKTKSSDDGKECIAFTDPIRMLFNQQRLSSIGSTAIQAWLDSLKSKPSDPFAEMRTKCSDSDLIALIKSRHIQQPSELLAYAKECSNNMKMFTEEVQNLMKAQKAVSMPVEPVEPTSSIEPVANT